MKRWIKIIIISGVLLFGLYIILSVIPAPEGLWRKESKVENQTGDPNHYEGLPRNRESSITLEEMRNARPIDIEVKLSLWDALKYLLSQIISS